MKWSLQAWNKVENVYNSILKHPFVRELAAGTLSRARFDFYIGQDALYIDNYSRVLAHIASRIPSKKHSEDFLRFALDGIMVERALHQSFISDTQKLVHPSPVCRQYMDFESSKAYAPVEVEAAAVLPCFWVYQRVGTEIIKTGTPDNPYSRWIGTYADEAFAASTLRAVEICDELADNTTQAVRDLMTEAFIIATKMEFLFWDSAYNSEQWKI